MKQVPVCINILLFCILCPGSLFAQNRPILRISVENTETHVQAQYVRRFSELLSERLEGAVEVRFFDSAQLFRDSEVVGAIARGDLEMAVPGTWQLSRYVPEIGYLLLPDFFGAERIGTDRFLKSDMGRELLARIEYNLNVIVPGKWMDLGAAHIFTTRKQIQRFDDFVGCRIRVAGGIANKMRVEIFGATGVIISWPDLPPRIRDGTVDGLLTTFETIRSAALWKDGIRFAFLDYEYFPQYVPIVSTHFWGLLTPHQQRIFRDTWDELALQQRGAAAQAQTEAMEVAQKNGIIITVPSDLEINKAHMDLQEHRSQIIRELGIDPDFIELEDR